MKFSSNHKNIMKFLFQALFKHHAFLSYNYLKVGGVMKTFSNSIIFSFEEVTRIYLLISMVFARALIIGMS